MGLLEKAGEMQTDKAPAVKKTKKPKPVKKAKPKKARKPKKEEIDLDDELDLDVQSATVPDEFELAGRGARFARSLIDFIVTYGWAVPIIALFAYGSEPDMTYFIIAGVLLSIFNLIVMPIMTNRTIGNYASITRYVTAKGNPPFFLHQTFKGLTWVFILTGLFLIATTGLGSQNQAVNTVNLGIGFGVLLIPLADWIVAKVRHETKQGLWDSMFFAYMVGHVRSGEETGFFARLESSGDWLKAKGWLDSEEGSGDD